MEYSKLTLDELIDKLSNMIDRQLVKGFKDNVDLLSECRRRLILANQKPVIELENPEIQVVGSSVNGHYYSCNLKTGEIDDLGNGEIEPEDIDDGTRL